MFPHYLKTNKYLTLMYSRLKPLQMIYKKPNFWFMSSFLVSILVAIPITTVFLSYFSSTSEYLILLKNTFLTDYILNSLIILIGVLSFTFIFGVVSAYYVSFYNFWGVNFFKIMDLCFRY